MKAQRQSRSLALIQRVMPSFPISRSYTAKLIRVSATHGLTFLGDTPHIASQLSLFDNSGSTAISGPEKSMRPTGPAITVLCIQKQPIRRFGSSSARSTAISTVDPGQRNGTAVASGYAEANFTKTAGCTSTRSFPRQRMIFGGLLTLSNTTVGGSTNSDSTGLNDRARSATCRTTSRTTSSKTDS